VSRILVTGANGFVGRALVCRLLGQAEHELTLVDRSFDSAAPPGVRQIEGSFGSREVLDLALRTPPDILFHLASVPGSLAEREHALGVQVNLHDTLTLAHRLAAGGKADSRRPRFVFASSVAVYGPLARHDIDEGQPARPAISYGAHKLMTEIELADLSRRGAIDAVSLRLPGIVARPASESGHGSAFMSLVMHRLAAGQPYVCPVSPEATAWWMSLPCCVDNLLRAASLSTAGAPASRTWQLPVLHLSMEQVVAALARRFGAASAAQLSYQPDEVTEALFGRYPVLHTPQALAAGFSHDGDADALVASAMAGWQELMQAQG
jgi:nucleoside-diphosphate-sugar epimerase